MPEGVRLDRRLFTRKAPPFIGDGAGASDASALELASAASLGDSSSLASSSLPETMVARAAGAWVHAAGAGPPSVALADFVVDFGVPLFSSVTLACSMAMDPSRPARSSLREPAPPVDTRPAPPTLALVLGFGLVTEWRRDDAGVGGP